MTVPVTRSRRTSAQDDPDRAATAPVLTGVVSDGRRG